MGLNWRQVPALLAGAGVLAATLYVIQVPTTGRAGPPERLPVRHGALVPSPAAPSRTRPSEALARAVERAARGALPEPYFADRREAARFLERWQGRLIQGKALVEQADQFDAGAEHGHRVPVTLWLDSGSRVLGLTGEAAFEPSPGGQRLQSLQLEPVSLAVGSWAEAAEAVRRAHPTAAAPEQGAAPFYGLFRFRLGGDQFAVDARTGEVIRE
ncbi:MAG: hypothetical protein ACOY94_09145 [Bacillota bacterium]